MDARRIVIIDAKANDKPEQVLPMDDDWGLSTPVPVPEQPDTNFENDEELI